MTFFQSGNIRKQDLGLVSQPASQSAVGGAGANQHGRKYLGQSVSTGTSWMRACCVHVCKLDVAWESGERQKPRSGAGGEEVGGATISKQNRGVGRQSRWKKSKLWGPGAKRRVGICSLPSVRE